MPSGFETKSSFTREPTTFARVWPAPTPGTATQLLPLIEEDVNIRLSQNMVVTKDTKTSPRTPLLVRTEVDGNFVVDLHYNSLEFIFAAALGQVANRISGVLMPEDVNADGSLYRHVIEIDERLKSEGWKAGDGFIAGPQPTGDGLVAGQQKIRRGTFTTSKVFTVWDSLSCMIDNLTLEANGNGVNLNCDVIGYSLDTASTTNSGITSINNCPDTRVLFREAKLFFTSAIGFGISALDDVGEITGFRLQLNNNLQAINTRDTGVNIDEPQKTGVTQVTGSFSLPRLLNVDLVDRNRDSTNGHMLLEFTGEPIGADNFIMRFWMPNVTLTGGLAPTQGEGRIQQNYTFVANVADDLADPPGFPTSTRQNSLLVEIFNTNASHPLLD